MTRRQALKSLCAAALAAVAPIPAMGAATKVSTVGTIALPDNLIDMNAPGPCCCCDDITFDPDKLTIEVVSLDCPSWRVAQYEVTEVHKDGVATVVIHWTNVGE